MRSQTAFPLESLPESVSPCPLPAPLSPLSDPISGRFLNWLRNGRLLRPLALPICLVAAHPDDEVIGAGAQLPCLSRLSLLHVTDGSPRNLLDATRAGFSSRAEYAHARAEELRCALALAGQEGAPCTQLGIPDQEASFHLVEVTLRLAELWAHDCPEVVLTHPYEGGHPDHDATAFSVRCACQWLAQSHLPAPSIIEFTSYHNNAGIMKTGEFLPSTSSPAVRAQLSQREQALKRQLLECFLTQQLTLAPFTVETECFRLAPTCNFTAPPHEGILFYELFDWGMTGARWRELAAEALRVLQIAGPV